MFEENQLVKLKKDLPYKEYKAGIIGTVVMVYNYTPVWGYEVEFSDEHGVPLGFDPDDPESFLTVTLHEEDLEVPTEEDLKMLDIDRANRLLYEALDNFQPDEGITKEAVTEALKIIFDSGSTEDKFALSQLIYKLWFGENLAAISDLLGKITRVVEVDGVVDGKFEQLYEAFRRGDAINTY
ncbi:DUF4926 domain-containing protein [Limnofasciculus baicalensis]|uniref:DUF4926 domain-containing protein n=1 Tax=Limnofasciculus baicalensis BBK-W-15 TaxID=2699891 RepID=A0AAE3KLU7_9CYAN|nr:DUF4926 domain-containing protein [Limnofasciculus baicalensis]MCP2728895.1 DUF4926 domain-containing protein [Limnofasciculus baicalensis BBK-W-15]